MVEVTGQRDDDIVARRAQSQVASPYFNRGIDRCIPCTKRVYCFQMVLDVGEQIRKLLESPSEETSGFVEQQKVRAMI